MESHCSTGCRRTNRFPRTHRKKRNNRKLKPEQCRRTFIWFWYRDPGKPYSSHLVSRQISHSAGRIIAIQTFPRNGARNEPIVLKIEEFSSRRDKLPRTSNRYFVFKVVYVWTWPMIKFSSCARIFFYLIFLPPNIVMVRLVCYPFKTVVFRILQVWENLLNGTSERSKTRYFSKDFYI